MKLSKSSVSRSTGRLLSAAGLIGAMALPAAAQTDSGPTQQSVPWRAPGAFDESLNSVVQIDSDTIWPPARSGTGSIVGKCVVGGIGWLAVLTADHVVRGDTEQRISFGNSAAQGFAGAPGTSYYVSRSPPGTQDADLAVLVVRYGAPDALFNGLLIMNCQAVNWWNGRSFTEVGYGGTGTFVAGGMTGAVSDGTKRFQNNAQSSIVNVNNADYNYQAVEWDFDMAPAFNTGAFLRGEGMSFSGDSGGPYFTDFPTTQNVPAFNRPGANNWLGGNMVLHFDRLVAVHTSGNSNNAGFNAYGTTFGRGVILTQTYVDWITQTVQTICPPPPPHCYPNCDGSTTDPVLNVLDFACFLNRYASGDPYANCDGSTVEPKLNVLDFACFLNAYAAGCP